MARPSLDNPIRAETANPGPDDFTRQKMREILELWGRAVCDEPQRCEALLRDFCPGHRREVFLLVAALKERAVPDILSSLGVLPEDVIISNLTRKLCDNLGLAEEAGRWAAESWVVLIREAPAKGKLTQRHSTPGTTSANPGGMAEGPPDSGTADPVRPASVDWVWIGLCFLSMTSALAALAVVARVSFYQDWNSFLDWVRASAVLGAGLGAAWTGEYVAARQFLRREAPSPSALDPRKTPAALLIEVLVLLAQPLVPVGTIALWLIAWVGGLHAVGQSHALAFNLGRLIQSALVAVFVVKWLGMMTTIQGRIASSMVRRR